MSANPTSVPKTPSVIFLAQARGRPQERLRAIDERLLHLRGGECDVRIDPAQERPDHGVLIQIFADRRERRNGMRAQIADEDADLSCEDEPQGRERCDQDEGRQQGDHERRP